MGWAWWRDGRGCAAPEARCDSSAFTYWQHAFFSTLLALFPLPLRHARFTIIPLAPCGIPPARGRLHQRLGTRTARDPPLGLPGDSRPPTAWTGTAGKRLARAGGRPYLHPARERAPSTPLCAIPTAADGLGGYGGCATPTRDPR